MYYKNISYLISHVFLMLFLYLFMSHRYSKAKTAGVCITSFFILCISDCLKLNIFPDSRICYLLVTVFQIFVTQFTGIFISKKRNSKVLFIGLSASNYVIAGSIMATILYIWTENMLFSMVGSSVVHACILLVLCVRIKAILVDYQDREEEKSWWELCLIPVFFYCGFSCLAFFPYTLDDHKDNILGTIIFIITMFISYVVVLRYMESESQRKEIYWKNLFFKSYIKGLEEQYYLVEQSEKNVRILRHDMRHYTSIIDSLLEQEEYDAIKKVTEHIKGVVDENKITKYCENLIANAVITSMMEKARSSDIEVNLNILIPKEIPIDDYEFASVIANLFENALLCVKNMDKEKRCVEVKIHCTKEHLMLHMQNKYETEVIFDDNTMLPMGNAGGEHGLGMQSVLAFADKIGGNVGSYCEDKVFHIVLFAKF